MANNQIEGSASRKKSGRRMTTAFIIFVLGVIVGVIGLCAALKFIFYIGLAVVILAGIGVVWAVFATRNDLRRDRNEMEQDD